MTDDNHNSSLPSDLEPKSENQKGTDDLKNDFLPLILELSMPFIAAEELCTTIGATSSLYRELAHESYRRRVRSDGFVTMPPEEFSQLPRTLQPVELHTLDAIRNDGPGYTAVLDHDICHHTSKPCNHHNVARDPKGWVSFPRKHFSAQSANGKIRADISWLSRHDDTHGDFDPGILIQVYCVNEGDRRPRAVIRVRGPEDNGLWKKMNACLSVGGEFLFLFADNCVHDQCTFLFDTRDGRELAKSGPGPNDLPLLWTGMFTLDHHFVGVCSMGYNEAVGNGQIANRQLPAFAKRFVVVDYKLWQHYYNSKYFAVGKIISFEKDDSLPIPPPLPHGYLRRESSIITVEEAFIGVDSPRRILHDTDDTSQLSSMESSTTTTTQQLHNATIPIQSIKSLRVNSNGDQQLSLKPPARSSRPKLSRKDKNTANFKLPSDMESTASPDVIEEVTSEKKHNRKQGSNELGIILYLFPTATPRRVLDLLINGSSLNEIIIMLGQEENETKI